MEFKGTEVVASSVCDVGAGVWSHNNARLLETVITSPEECVYEPSYSNVMYLVQTFLIFCKEDFICLIA